MATTVLEWLKALGGSAIVLAFGAFAFNSLESRISDTSSAINGLSAELSSVTRRIDALNDSLGQRMDDLYRSQADLSASVDQRLGVRIDNFANRQVEFSAQLSRLTEQVNRLTGEVERLTEQRQGAIDRVSPFYTSSPASFDLAWTAIDKQKLVDVLRAHGFSEEGPEIQFVEKAGSRPMVPLAAQLAVLPAAQKAIVAPALANAIEVVAAGCCQ